MCAAKFSRQHYVVLAEALRTADSRTNIDHAANRHGVNNKEEAAHSAVMNTAGVLCLFLERDNPRFNRTHFLAVVNGEKSITSRPARKVGA